MTASPVISQESMHTMTRSTHPRIATAELDLAFEVWMLADRRTKQAHADLLAQWPEGWPPPPAFETFAHWPGRYGWHERADAVLTAAFPETCRQTFVTVQGMVPLLLAEARAIAFGERDDQDPKLLTVKLRAATILLDLANIPELTRQMLATTSADQAAAVEADYTLNRAHKTPMELAAENARMIAEDRKQLERVRKHGHTGRPVGRPRR
jgi:hypothetical protein